jgi:hypothetical protein
VIKKLASLPRICSIHLGCRLQPIPHTNGFQDLEPHKFESLRELALWANPTVASSVTRQFDNTPLRKLYVELPDPLLDNREPQSLRALFTIVSSSLSSSLEALFVVTYLSPGPERTDLLHITKLRGMKHLSLALGGPLWLDDEVVSSLAAQTSELESLQLSPRLRFSIRGPFPQPLVTLSGLINILGSCPHLQSLAVVMDLTQTGGYIGGSAKLLASNLRELDVGRSSIKDPLMIASILSGLLPSLSELKWVSKKRNPASMLISIQLGSVFGIRSQPCH